MKLWWRRDRRDEVGPLPADSATKGGSRLPADRAADVTRRDESAAADATLAFPVASRRLAVPPLNRPALRWLAISGAATLLGSLLGILAGGDRLFPVVLQAVLATAALYGALRFCLLDSAARVFWWIWLGLGLVAVLISGAHVAGRWVLFGLGLVFFLARRYRPLRQLTSAQRAGAALLALIALVIVVIRPGWGGVRDLGWLSGVVVNLGRASGMLLFVFWFLILNQLFFGMRLHFLRLRPKLALSAVLIGVVPLVLVVLLGLLVLFAALGGSRASRARDTLLDYRELAAEGVDLEGTVFARGFAWSPGEPAADPAPAWAPALWRGVEIVRERETTQPERRVAPDRSRSGDTPAAASSRGIRITFGDDDVEATGAWTASDTTAFFLVEGFVWLIRVDSSGSSAPRLRGLRLDSGALDRVSRIVGADVGLVFERADAARDSAAAGESAAAADTTASSELKVSVQGHARPRPGDPDLWHRPLYCGGSLLEVIRFDHDRFPQQDALLALQLSLADLGEEFLRGGRNLNLAAMIALGVLAALFLFIEAVAAFFGLRITGGIIGAVKQLHRGTRRLAAGDLSVRIDIPNEDEFGDLAHSFNEMTAAVERGRRMAVARERLLRELETAREIQRRLLPQAAPGLSGFEIAGTSIPSRQVGGDYYDFLDYGDGRIGVAVGDVSGKGMPAALLMSNLQASLQGQVIHPATVADIVARVNDLLVQSTDPHMFATFFYGVLDTRQSLFTSSNAGHNHPILRRADGRVERLGAGGLILGMMPEQSYEQETVTLEHDDIVVLFTDGITEAVARSERAGGPDGVANSSVGGLDDTAGAAPPAAPPETAADLELAEAEELPEDPSVMFGEGALLEVVARSAHLSAEEIKDTILNAVARHTAGAAQSDDITLVVIKRTAA